MCPDCGKCFSVKSNLKKHLQLHTRVRAFPCDQCDKSFVDQRRLDIHARIHDSVKPFPCPHCQKGYVDANSLKKHLRNHECEECGTPLTGYDDRVRHRAEYHPPGAGELEAAAAEQNQFHVRGVLVKLKLIPSMLGSERWAIKRVK